MTNVLYSGSSITKALPNYTFPEAPLLGNAFWGGLPDGAPIPSMDKHLMNAQDRFNKAKSEAKARGEHFEFTPLVNPFPDYIIQKAIFTSNAPSKFKTSAERFYADMEPLAKAYAMQVASENPDTEVAEEINKAVTTGSSLMHVIADQAVTLLYKRPYPIQALIPVEANIGKAANWDIIPPFGFNSATFLGEDPNLTETDISPSNRTDYIKYMYAVGRVTQAAQFAGLSQYPTRDMKTISIDASQEALRALRERSMLGVTRDVSEIDSIAYEDANSLQYAGMHEIITNNTTSPNWVTSTGSDYDSIMADLRNSYRLMVKDGIRPNLAITDYATFDTIAAGLMEYFRTEPIKEFTQGISKISLVFAGTGGLPLIPTEFKPMDAGSQGIDLIDTKLWARRVLWQDMYQDLAKINTSDKFVISAAEVLIDKTDKNTSGSTTGGLSLHGGVYSIGA